MLKKISDLFWLMAIVLVAATFMNLYHVEKVLSLMEQQHDVYQEQQKQYQALLETSRRQQEEFQKMMQKQKEARPTS